MKEKEKYSRNHRKLLKKIYTKKKGKTVDRQVSV